MLRAFQWMLVLFGFVAAAPAFACGFSPSESAQLRERMHQADRDAVGSGDAVVTATLVRREGTGEGFDVIFYEFSRTAVVAGAVDEQTLQSGRRTGSSCGPLPYLYVDWDDTAVAGVPVVLLIRRDEDGVARVMQAARTNTPDGQNMLEAASLWSTGN